MYEVSATSLRAWARHLGVRPEDVDAEKLRHDLALGTIPGALAATATIRPGVALTVDGVRSTHAQLRADAARQASVLSALGVTQGTRVMINAPSSLSLVVCYLAVLHLGAVAVLTNPAYTPAELEAVIERTGVTLLLVDDESERTASVPQLRWCDLVAAAEHAAEHPPVNQRGEDVALLAFTSGTTGSPKVVPLTHGQLLASIRAAMRAWRWTTDDVLVHALPLFHQHGLSGIHASLVAGSNATVLAKFDPHELLAAIVRDEATVLFGVPSVHQRLLSLDTEQLAPLRRLRLITSGSAPLPIALAGGFRERTGVQPLERYGLTEAGLDVSDAYDGERAFGTVGYPLPGVELALTDPHGDPVPTGDDGEIVLRGPQVFDGYLDDPEANNRAFWTDGWFRTGDLGRLDAEGRLVISGRLKDLVITGGMNVTPQEVEEVVARFPGVREAAMAGLPSQTWGEEVAVWVVLEEGSALNADGLIAHCRGQLAAYKCPKHVFGIDELPRSPLGKITRNKLAGTGPS